jgi:DNA-directed RNA polymerase specialized sigma24 family protein
MPEVMMVRAVAKVHPARRTYDMIAEKTGSLLEHRPVNERSGDAPPATAGVRVLKALLRCEPEGRTAAATRAVDALVAELRTPLLRYCEGLARQGRGDSRWAALATDRRIDAEDLAQEAWTKCLRYLAGAAGDRIRDDEHLRRLLRCAAKTIFLDRVTKGSAPAQIVELDAPMRSNAHGAGGDARSSMADMLVAPIGGHGAPPEGGRVDLMFLHDERWIPLIEFLFRDEAAFHRMYRRKHQRRPRQYQAFVLYQLGVFYRAEVGADADDGRVAAATVSHLIRRYISLLGISERQWAPIATAAVGERGTVGHPEDDPGSPDGIDLSIASAVNSICGTNIKASNMLAVLRYEMNQFVAMSPASSVREKEGAQSAGR